MSRFFYVINVADKALADCFNAVRLIADSRTKHSTHVTVMGPYASERSDFVQRNAMISGARIRLYSNGTFFEPKQNTVFLKASSSNLQRVWDKPDVSSYSPHLTLYDGGDRFFAKQIVDVLRVSKIDVSFVCDGLSLLQPQGQTPRALFDTIYVPAISEILGADFSFTLVQRSTHGRRIIYITRLLQHLSSVSVPIVSRKSQAEAVG